jgi:hypothetical protein
MLEHSGGQVPLLKHAIMQYLLDHRRGDRGHVASDINTYTFVEATKASPPNVNRALWDLQGLGLITFRESKRSGTNGHSSTTVLDRMGLTPKGLGWTAEKAVLTDLPSVSTLSDDDMNPALMAEAAVDDVTRQMTRHGLVTKVNRIVEGKEPWMVPAGDTPPMALLHYLQWRGSPAPITEANIALGYNRKSTALYSIVSSYPEAFVRSEGRITLIAPPDWQPKSHSSGSRRKETLLIRGRYVGPLPSPVPVDDKPIPPTSPIPPTPVVDPIAEKPVLSVSAPEASLVIGPQISALMDREAKRAAVAVAVQALESAGLDDVALQALAAVPDDSPLEAEVVALIKSLERSHRVR